MTAKELFFRKIEARKPQVMEIASEAGLHNLASTTGRELISKWVIEDAAEMGLEPVAILGALRGRLDELEKRRLAHRERIALAVSRFGGLVARKATKRFGRILEGTSDLASFLIEPLLVACMAARVALVRASRNRAEMRDAERQLLRDAASQTLLDMFEHYRARGVAAAALRPGGMNRYA